MSTTNGSSHPSTSSKRPPLDLKRVPSVASLARALGLTDSRLSELMTNPTNYYQKKLLRKRDGKGRRTVYSFDSDWSAAQRHVARSVVASQGPTAVPSCVHGFVKRRSIASNAAPHCGQKLVLCFDLQNCFESITDSTVNRIFKRLGAISEVAEVLTKLCTVNSRLAQGSAASPALSNLAMAPLDHEMVELGLSFGSTYTRYADDMTFSGDEVPPIDTVAEIIKTQGFKLNADKVRTQRRGGRRFVTGVVVSDPEGPRALRRAKNNLRLELFYAEKYGLAQHLQRTEQHGGRLEGRLAFLKSIEPNRGESFLKRFRALQRPEEDA